MSLVPALLRGMVLVDGEALVLHVGDRPYVLSAAGRLDLAARGLTADAVSGAIAELLPAEAQRTLRDVGDAHYELTDLPEFPGERFGVVAARGGDDVWVEVRRRVTTLPDWNSVSVSAVGAPARLSNPTSLSIPAPPPPQEDLAHLAVEPLRGSWSEGPSVSGHEALPVGLDDLLRLAAARGASMLYVSSGVVPSIRVDGAMLALDGTPVFSASDVEALLCAPSVAYLSFRDHQGPGGVFRIAAPRARAAQQLGLSRDVRDLVADSEGLVILAGQGLKGKRALMSALVDHINRTRQVHVVTIEREIDVVHERLGSFVSQREAVGSEDVLEAIRTALREEPDVLVIERASSAEAMRLALDAAVSGRLVICGFPSYSAAAAVEGIVGLLASESRRHLQITLAHALRGVVLQVLANSKNGERLTARELLLNTPEVAHLIADGQISQLPVVIEGGRDHSASTINDALAGFVASGAVDVREAWLQAYDKTGMLAALERRGIDTSSLERLR